MHTHGSQKKKRNKKKKSRQRSPSSSSLSSLEGEVSTKEIRKIGLL